jgi:hypothetical protein
MRGRFACLLAVTMAAGLSGVGITASAGTAAAGYGAHGTGLGHSSLRASHYGGSRLRSRGSYGHTNSLSGLAGHQSSGWYQRGFGGNRDPGWGYRFGPGLGGPPR